MHTYQRWHWHSVQFVGLTLAYFSLMLLLGLLLAETRGLSSNFHMDASQEMADACPETRITIQKPAVYTGCSVQDVRDSSQGAVFSTVVSVQILQCSFTDCVSSYQAGVIYANAKAIVDFVSCTFTRCSANSGGVAFLLGREAGLIFSSCTFTECSAKIGGVASSSQGNVTFADSKFTRCSANSGSGGVLAQAVNTVPRHITFFACVAMSCSTVSSGGVIYIGQVHSAVIQACQFFNCSAKQDGGVLAEYITTVYGVAHVTMTECYVKESRANRGGAVEVLTSSATINKCHFIDCCSYSYGSVICRPCATGSYYQKEELQIQNCRIERSNVELNVPRNTVGGAIATSSNLAANRIVNCSFYDCRSDGIAAAILMLWSTTGSSPASLGVVESCEMLDCVSRYSGSAIYFSYLSGTLKVNNIVCQDCYSIIDSIGLVVYVRAAIFNWDNLCLASRMFEDGLLVDSNVNQPYLNDIKHGTSGVCPVPTQPFSPSREFTVSNTFVPSESFSNSRKFTASRHFTKSGKFTRSDTFTKSSKFTLTGEFTKTSEFTNSGIFIPTRGLTKSSAHTSSASFTKSHHFTESDKFTPTGAFTKTNEFILSANFIENTEENGSSSVHQWIIYVVVSVVIPLITSLLKRNNANCCKAQDNDMPMYDLDPPETNTDKGIEYIQRAGLLWKIASLFTSIGQRIRESLLNWLGRSTRDSKSDAALA